MPDIVSIITSNICSSISESLNDKVKTKLEMSEMKTQLKEVFFNYEKEYDLEKIAIHLQLLVPQMVSYCSNPEGVSLSQKTEEIVDLLQVSSNKKSITTDMVYKVLNIVNRATNSTRSHDAKSIENRQEQRHAELTNDHSEIKIGIEDIKKELRNIHTESAPIEPTQNLRAQVVPISNNQYKVTIEAIREAVPGATFAFACKNDINDFYPILTGFYTCGQAVLSVNDGSCLNARLVTPMHIQVRPGFPCEFIIEYKEPLNDYSIWLMTSQSPPRYSKISII